LARQAPCKVHRFAYRGDGRLDKYLHLPSKYTGTTAIVWRRNCEFITHLPVLRRVFLDVQPVSCCLVAVEDGAARKGAGFPIDARLDASGIPWIHPEFTVKVPLAKIRSALARMDPGVQTATCALLSRAKETKLYYADKLIRLGPIWLRPSAWEGVYAG
jgi:hypothetical protein